MSGFLFERIDKKEMEQLSEDIKHSLDAHRTWMNDMHISVATGKPPEDDQFCASDAHKRCKFGQWLYRLLESEEFSQSDFADIESLHQSLHHCARFLTDQLKAGQRISEPDYGEFLTLQKLFYDQTMGLYEATVINQHQFDSITNLMNRRTADTVLAHEKHRMSRADNSTCCVALADIDLFKNVNDQYGHQEGDRALAHIAELFHGSIRRHDTVARFGGEEFLFVFPDMTLREAETTVDRIRAMLEKSPMTLQSGEQIKLTASFGLTQMLPDMEIRDCIQMADFALYQAKHQGRNACYCVDATELQGLELNNNTLSDAVRQVLTNA